MLSTDTMFNMTPRHSGPVPQQNEVVHLAPCRRRGIPRGQSIRLDSPGRSANYVTRHLGEGTFAPTFHMANRDEQQTAAHPPSLLQRAVHSVEQAWLNSAERSEGEVRGAWLHLQEALIIGTATAQHLLPLPALPAVTDSPGLHTRLLPIHAARCWQFQVKGEEDGEGEEVRAMNAVRLSSGAGVGALRVCGAGGPGPHTAHTAGSACLCCACLFHLKSLLNLA